MTTERPSLAEFERRVAARDQRGALAAAFAILHLINLRYGRVDRVEIDGVRGKPAGEVAEIFATRFAAALGTLLTDPDFRFAPGEYPRLAVFHRWIDLIFGVSGFRSSDHLFELLGKRGGEGGLTFAQESLTRVLAMRSLGSRFGLNLEELWRTNTGAAAVAFLHYLGSRWLFNGAAHAFREKLLEWLPARLDKVEIRDSTLGRIVETCMLCSYATTPKKHEIKSVLLRQLRRACLAAGVAETPPAPPPAPGSRPTVVVVCEHFSLGHSMFRTHSLAVRSLRERFHVIGVMFQYQIGPEVLELFDEMIPLEQTGLFEQVKAVAGEIARRSPALIFFPSVGMMPHAVALATLRLAPVQCASYGHAASTMSPAMDHIILPEDFVGARGRFSENVVALPARAMPFVRRRPKSPIPAPSPESARSGIVRVAVPAAIMKLNPRLFAALARIAKEAKTPVEFHFYPLGAQGLVSVALSEALRKQLPMATAFREAPFELYMERLSRCDFFLSPFPYGNTNSIVDAVGAGLPGVCLDGPEPHEHIDAGLFARMKFPPSLAAKTADDYVAAAVKLIDDSGWRAHCRKIAAECDMDAAFFTGDARLFCEAVAGLVWPRAGD